VNRFRAVLNAAYNYALQEEWWGLSENPCARTRKRPEDEPREQMLTDAQRTALFEACQAHPETWVHPLVLLAFATGMRAGALLALKWSDVNLDAATLTIRQRTAKNSKPSVKRLVPKVVAVLREYGKVRSLTDDQVFPPRRRGAERLNYNPAWKAVRKAAGIPTSGPEKFVFNSLRHDHASVQVQAGIPLLQVSKQLDHSNTQITERYAHLAPGDAEFEELARAMEDKL
jgi:integrase